MAAGPVSTPPKAAAAKAPAKSVPSPLASYGLTPGQLRQMVSAEVASQLAPQRQALTQAQQATDNQYGQARNALQNLTTGYAQLLAPISGQVRSTYDNAANSIADYAKGFTGVLQQNLNQGNAADQAILGVAGAPASQQAEVAGHLQAPVDALYGMRGALPAGALQNAGAAFTSAAEMLPGMAVARGQQNALALTGEQGNADAKYRQQLSNLLASVPKLAATDQSGILSNAAKAEQLALEEQTLGLKVQNQGFTQGLDQAKYNLSVGKQRLSVDEWNAKQRTADTTINPKVSAGIGDGLAHNAQGAVVYGPGNQPIKFSAAKAAAKGPKVATDSVVNKFLSSLPTYQTQRTKDANGNTTTTKNPTGKFTMSFMNAYRRLRNMGLSDLQARQDLQSIYPRGAQGRGWLTNEEQAVLKAAAGKVQGPGVSPVSIATVRKSPKGSGYLSRQQFQILSQAGMDVPGHPGHAPNGEWIWWISQKV